MKKQYISPVVHVVKIHTCELLAGSGSATSVNNSYTESEQLSREFKGSSIWDDDEE